MPGELDGRRGGRVAVELLDVGLELAAHMDTETQVQLGSTIFASLVLGRSRMPVLLAVMAAVGFGYAARRAYVVVHDVHVGALALVELAAAEGVGPDPGGPGEDRAS